MSLNQTIADLILEGGRARAAGVAGSGQAWGSALSNIGQSIGQTLTDLPRQREEQHARKFRDALSEELKNTPRLDQNGVQLTDVSAIQQRLSDRGFGAEASSAIPHLQSINDALTSFQQSRMNVVKQGAVAIASGGFDPDTALDFLEHVVKPNHIFSDALVSSWEAHIKDNPSSLKSIISTIAGPQEAKILHQGDVGFDPVTNAPIPGMKVAPKPEVINGQLVQTDTGEKIGEPIPRQATPLDPAELKLKEAQLREIEARLSGTLPLSAKDRADLTLQRERLGAEIKHWNSQDQANNPLAALTGGAVQQASAPQAEGPHGEDFLKSLPAGIASEVKAYAEGKRPFPAGFALKSPYFQSMIQMVGQYDPTFDAANYNARNKTRMDLESPSGTGGKTISALNTAVQHAGKLSDLIEKLDNSEIPLANAVMNPVRSAFGKTEVTNFKAVAPQLMKEIERVWRGTGGSTADIQELIDSISKNAGKQQQREALDQFVGLMEGKLDALTSQRDAALGPLAGKSIPILFEQNKPIIETIRQRAAGDAGQQAPAAAPQVGATVQYQGKSYKVTGIKDGQATLEPLP